MLSFSLFPSLSQGVVLDISNLFKPIAGELKRVEAELRSAMESQCGHPEIREASLHALQAGGKRLRPALLLLVARLGDYDSARAIRASVVVEQIHMATLIHDDVVDQAKLRRGQQAVNDKWHNKFAVLLGDFLYSSAFLAILSDPDLRIVEAVVTATKMMTKGELLQAILCGNPDISEEEYFQVIEAKTAQLISACCCLGACIAGFEPDDVKRMTRYGYHLGIAFQITDDVLDIMSSSKKLGKPAGHDAREGNFTLPLIISLKRANLADRKELRDFLGQPIDDYSWANISEFLNRYEGVEYALFIAKDHILKAHQCLERVQDGPTTKILHNIADYIISRDF